MKNFKKVIAFLMVAAMTLGMGLTAFATETTGEAVDVDRVALFEAGKVEATDGETVTVTLLAKQTLDVNAAGFDFELNPEVVDTDVETVKGLNNPDKDGLMAVAMKGLLGGGSYTGDIENTIAVSIVGMSTTTDAGVALVTITVPLKKAVEEGDVIGTFKFADTMTVTIDGDESEVLPENVEVTVSAKVTETEPPTTPVDPQNPTDPATPQGGEGTPGAATNNNTNSSTQPTTVALPKAADIKNTTNALEALLAMVENGKYSDVLSVAKAIDNASNFTSKDNYNNFKSKLDAYEKVLANPNATQAEKDAAYNALIETMQENLLSNSGKKNLIKNVQDKLNALNGVPAATKTGKGGKTGDTAPVAALIIVAIAAFGTAVVVYRKKVNA